MPEVTENKSGKITVSKDVIAQMAGFAASECYGVVGMASQKLQDGIYVLLRRENTNKGVIINFIENKVNVDIYIVVSYGVKITEVAQNIIDKVRYILEKHAGIPIEHVNVIVQGVKVIA